MFVRLGKFVLDRRVGFRGMLLASLSGGLEGRG